MGLNKGQTNNPGGRPKGTKNKFTGNVKEMFLTVFVSLQNDSKTNLEAWAKNNPTEFYKLMGRLMPKEIEVKQRLIGLGGLDKKEAEEEIYE